MDTKEKQRLMNPRETSNCLSVLFFGWLVPIFWKGSKRDLEAKDLYDPLKSDESKRLGDRLEREWKKELMKANQELKLGTDGKKKPRRKLNLFWAVLRMFWLPYMLQGLMLLFGTVILQIMRAVLQGWVIEYFNPGHNLMTQNQALLYAGLLVTFTAISLIVHHHFHVRSQQIGMCIRIACCSLIYRKILRLNQAAVNNTAAGLVANLISNDVARFDIVLIYLHFIWILPIQVALAGYVIWPSVGIVALVGIGVLIAQTVPVQGYFSSLSAKLRSKIAARTDERVQLMSELISGIEVVKMYSWEKPFESLVSKVRGLEMKLISLTSYLRGSCTSIMLLSNKITVYIMFVTFALMGNPLRADSTFVVLSLFNTLQLTCGFYFPQAVNMAGETVVSFERLTEFLLLDEVKDTENDKPGTKDGPQIAEKKTTRRQIEHGVGIEMVKVAANWVHGQLPPTLCEVSLEVKSRSLCVVVGPVGSGKSSLLHLILGELPLGVGQLSLSTSENSQTRITRQDISISYSSQEPWLFSGSIRDNILFGQKYDERRYNESSLSGFMISDQSPVMLLQFIRNLRVECVLNVANCTDYRPQVTRVCALYKDFEELPQGDLSFVGERGASLSGGQRARVNLARAVYRDADLYLLDDPLSAVDARVGRQLFEECITGFLKDKTRILVTHQLQYLREADNVVVLDRGTVKHQGSYNELTESNFHVLGREESEESDTTETIEGNRVEHVKNENTVAPTDGNNQRTGVTEIDEGLQDANEEETETGKISGKVYWNYFSAGGDLCLFSLLVGGIIAGQIALSGVDYWLTYWTDQETLRIAFRSNSSAVNVTGFGNITESDVHGTGSQWVDEFGLIRSKQAIYVYSGCIVACILLVTLRTTQFVRMCMNASRNIHNFMFANLLQATMRFFNTNPTGRILNRFSKDVGAMDELLPRPFLEAVEIFSAMVGALVTVLILNSVMILPVIIIGGLFYFIITNYLKTAQSLKRLEGITKSPVFSYVSSTLDGLTTIRSRGTSVQGLLLKQFDGHQDTHTGAWYLTISTATAFGLLLDLISTAFVACVCFSCILMDDGNTLGGSVGLAITQSLVLTGMVQYGIRQSTEVISQMTSVERVLQYTNLPKEGPFTTDKTPPPTWPPKGGLIFKDVCMRYADNKPPVLKDLNLRINPGWKIGIVGRTGAGKSSLISALFRLTGDGLEGEIALDGIDTKSIGLHELRPRISIIPQEPILFSASLRYNLDPFEQYSDAELWNSIREVELGDAVPSLDFLVAGGGANFSVGQRQLICLARAILRNNRVLVLDEATANVDPRTDTLIQNMIRRRFADCTVLTIAHRLNTIMDSDRVLVMAGGRIVEFDHPHLLLKNREGHFAQMLEQTGKAMADKLAEIAESAFLLNPEFGTESNHNTATVPSNQITYL